MPTPTGSTAFSEVALSSNPLTDSLVYGTKWGGALGAGVTLSYSFLSNNSYYASEYSLDNEYLDSYQLSSNQKAAVTQALGAWAAVANISFSLTTDSTTNTGDLRFGGYAGMDSDTAAWAYLPNGEPVGGDVWIGTATSEINPAPGTYDYLTFVHEIGHALGLKHPFESDSSNPTVLPAEYDDVRYTVMSYTDPYYYEPTTPMLLDIAAIQYLYGANMQWQTVSNTYQWAANTSVFETIWDAGGTDTINASNQTQAVTLDLNPGTFSSIGETFWNGSSYINNGLAIAYGVKIENAVGSAYADNLTGNQWANVLNGGAGADTMSGGNGNDSYFVDNTGDIVSEANATASIGGTDTVYSYLADYTLGANVENLRLLATGTANGTGNSLNNLIYAGAGNNILDGGAGTDTVSYGYASSAVSVSLSHSTAQATGGSGSDTLLNIENLTGSKYDDKLTGNAAANTFSGGAGNDILNGLAGADRMIGGDGSDSYFVDNINDVVIETNATTSTGGTDTPYSYLAAYTLGANVENLRLLATGAANGTGNSLNNLIYAGAGSNILDGGAGSDTASYAYASSAVSVSLATTTAQNTGGSGSDTLLNIENLTGSQYNDKLTGNATANTLNGAAGNDILNGLAGADRMIGGDGSDSYFVDNINDVVIETNATTSTGGTDTLYSYLAAYTLGANVENLRLLATGTANGTGNDLNNLIYAGAGNNILDGGAGTDTVSYGYASSAVSVSLATTTAQNTGGSGSDTLLNIENLTGSQYNDKLTGNATANTLNGAAGNDILNGLAGADRMIGGDGNDIYCVENIGDVVIETKATTSIGGTDTVYSYLADYTLGANVENLRLLATGTANGTGNDLNNLLYAGTGNNILDGGAGSDTVAYSYAASAVTVNLAVTASQATGGSGSDTLLNIENLTGSQYNDKLTGNAAANTLSGAAGNDILNGGAGADRMIGGDGNDSYFVDNIDDVVSETNATTSTGGTDTLYSYLAAYTLGANVENLRLLATGDANGTGNDLNNLIYAGAGNNILDGGAGTDTVSYGYASSAVSVNLATTTAQNTGGSGSDTLLNIESLTGSQYNDELTGNANANTLSGGAGNDTLIGGAGNDLLIGGLGTDTLYGGSGADRFDFSSLIEMGLGSLRDVIGDFNSSEGDKIDLSTLDANTATATNDAFSFIGSSAFSSTNAAGELRFADGILYGSINADANAEFEIQLLGVASLSSTDLIA